MLLKRSFLGKDSLEINFYQGWTSPLTLGTRTFNCKLDLCEIKASVIKFVFFLYSLKTDPENTSFQRHEKDVFSTFTLDQNRI